MQTVRGEKLRNRSSSPHWARNDRGERGVRVLASSTFDSHGDKEECFGRRSECYDVVSSKVSVSSFFEGERSRRVMDGERGVYSDGRLIDTRRFNHEVKTQRSLADEVLPQRNSSAVKFQWNHLLEEKGVNLSDSNAASPYLNKHLRSSYNGGGGVTESTRMSAERDYQGTRYSDLGTKINGAVTNPVSMENERARERSLLSYYPDALVGRDHSMQQNENEKARERGLYSHHRGALLGGDHYMQRDENDGIHVHDNEELAIRETLREYESRKMELYENSHNQGMLNNVTSNHPMPLTSHPQLQGHDYASGSVAIAKNRFPAIHNDPLTSSDGVIMSPGMLRKSMARDGHVHVAGSSKCSGLQVEDEIEHNNPYQVNTSDYAYSEVQQTESRGLATVTDEIRGRMANAQNGYDHQERSEAKYLDPIFDRVNDNQRFHGDHIRATRASKDHRSVTEELSLNYLGGNDALSFCHISSASHPFIQGHESLMRPETHREHEGERETHIYGDHEGLPDLQYYLEHEVLHQTQVDRYHKDLFKTHSYREQEDLHQTEFHRNEKYQHETQRCCAHDELHQTQSYRDHKELHNAPTYAVREDLHQIQVDKDPKDLRETKMYGDHQDLRQTRFYGDHKDPCNPQTHGNHEDLHQMQAYRDLKHPRDTQIYNDHEDGDQTPFYREHRDLYATKVYDDYEEHQEVEHYRDDKDLRETQVYADDHNLYELQRRRDCKGLHETQTNADCRHLHESQKHYDNQDLYGKPIDHDHKYLHQAELYRDKKGIHEVTGYPGRKSLRVDEDFGTGGTDSFWPENGHLGTSGFKISESMLKRKRGEDMKISRQNSIGQLVSHRNVPHNTYDPISSRYEQPKVEDIDNVHLPNYLRDYQARKELRSSRKICDSNDWLANGNLPTNLRARLSKSYLSAGIDIKKWLKPGSKTSMITSLGKKKLIVSKDDSLNGSNDAEAGNPSETADISAKINMSEDSQDFKQLVNNSFLKFVKQLYENPAEGRRYIEQGKAGKFRCSICNSTSVFMDTKSLAMHAFNSRKVGLRSQHLGFHKALCLLLGWDSTIPANCSMTSLYLPNDKAMALRRDLILWPPVVIIHNISLRNKDPAKRTALTIEDVGTILKDMGFSGERIKVCRGKPANNSIMVVKFKGTFSGLQEAEKLHKLYSDTKHGRLDSQLINSDSNNSHSLQENSLAEKAKHVLYGCLGIAEDLDQLDFGTKKRSLVKSKKEIEAIAGASLKAV